MPGMNSPRIPPCEDGASAGRPEFSADKPGVSPNSAQPVRGLAPLRRPIPAAMGLGDTFGPGSGHFQHRFALWVHPRGWRIGEIGMSGLLFDALRAAQGAASAVAVAHGEQGGR